MLHQNEDIAIEAVNPLSEKIDRHAQPPADCRVYQLLEVSAHYFGLRQPVDSVAG